MAKDPVKLRAKSKRNGAKYRFAHPQRIRERATVWRDANRGRLINYRLCHLYGVGLGYIKALLEMQGGKCALCDTPLEYPASGSHVDHSHTTGKVRGVLCAHCNCGLGHVEKSGWLKRAKFYLGDNHEQ